MGIGGTRFTLEYEPDTNNTTEAEIQKLEKKKSEIDRQIRELKNQADTLLGWQIILQCCTDGRIYSRFCSVDDVLWDNVHDSCCGMKKPVLVKIFELTYRPRTKLLFVQEKEYGQCRP